MIENLIHILQSLNIGLRIENGDLKINAPKGTLTPEIIEDIKAHKNELITLLSSSESIPKAEIKDSYALTSSQHRLWTLSQFGTGNSAYNIFDAFEFKGVLNLEKLTEAYKIIVERHESLRTVFKEDEEGNLGQYIVPVAQFKGALQLTDLTNATEEALSNHADTLLRHAFDLEKGPLFIGEIVKAAADRHILMLNMHHIIGDGWSMGVLSKEFMAIYNGLSTGNEVILPELSIQYKDYSEWQNSEARQAVLEKSKASWLDRFSGELPVLELPSSTTRPKLKTYNGSGVDYSFSKENTAQLNAYAQQNGVTLFMLLMAGINGLLYRYTNAKDLILGTPVAGREHSDLENQVGLYLNTLAIRTTFEQEVTFEELLTIQKETLLTAYSHQDYPFDSLVEELGIKRDLSRSVLFDVLVVFQNQQELLKAEGLVLNGLEIAPYKNVKKSFSKFDLTFYFSEIKGQLSLRIGYNTDIYEADFVTCLASHFDSFLTEAVQNPNQKVATLEYISSSEKKILLQDFNTSKAELSLDTTAVALFEEQVAKTPDAVALIFEDRSLTYKELDEVSNELAHYLLNNFEINAEDLITVKLDRREWIYISLLAVLKTGAAYLPIDPTYPEQRIAYIEQDSQSKVIIDERLLADFRSRQENYPTTSPEIALDPNQLMYVIYTSGSTGQPKGVMIEHKSLVNYIINQTEEFGLDHSDRVLQFSNNAFDASMEQIFLALFNGASLIGVSKERIIDPADFINVLQEYSVTHLHATPGYLSHLENLSSCKTLKRIVAAGEICPKNLAEKMVKIATFYNKYGPTEATISATMCRVDTSHLESNLIPIGKPLKGSEVYILSDDQALKPIGVFGEICISGDSLSRGYLNQEELTAEKFIPNPFIKGAKLYKTGDLGRWLADGNIEFSGRKDHQVKVRGHRIELGEIEHALLAQENINQCVVTVQEIETEAVIVAYLVGEKPVDKQELRSLLSHQLPDYMVPGYYVQVDAIALTSHGKIDLKALPAIGTNDLVQQEYSAPVTALEKELVAIWEEILGIKNIGVTDNFFELGGHSLKVILVANKINRQLGYQISVKDVFLNPTITGIISKLEAGAFTAIPKAEEQEDYVLTSSQHRLWILSQFEGGNQAYNIPGSFELEGSLNLEHLTQAFKTVISRHEILRTSFKRNEEGEVRQFISDPSDIDFKIDYADFTTVENQQATVEKRVEECYKHQFDLGKAPLINLHLLKLEENRHLLLFNMHHIISDGWSMGILSNELLTLYHHLVQGINSNLPELTIQYKDYTSWMRSEKQLSKLKESEAYWLNIFSGDLPVLEIPTPKMRPKVKTYAGDSITHSFTKETSNNLQSFSEQHQASLFMVLMAGINGLLSRYSNTRDLILGTPVAGREHSDLENQIGLYLNTLAIRTTFEETASFETLLETQKDTLLNAYSHQEYPLDNLVEELGLGRDTSRSALFDVLVVLQNQQDLFASDQQIEGLTLTPYKGYQRKVSQFDLSFIFSEKEGQLILHIEYNTDIYESEFVARLASHLETFLTEAIQNPSQKVDSLNYLGTGEKTQLLYDFNDTTVEYPNTTMVDLFVNQVKKTPLEIALVTDDKTFTYQELDELSNELSHYLLSNYNLGIEDLVGVKLGRTEWLPLALLAVLKSGCAYVPIDPNYPAQRIAYIEQDSKCKVTIDEAFIKAFNQSESISKVLPQITFNPDNLAYIIYTSGSTGKPKGVMITHQNASKMLHWSQREFSDTNFEILYAVTSHCFDLSVYEFFYPLSIGKKIRLLTNGLAIGDYIQNDQNVLINTVPSVVHTLIEKGTSFENAVGINLAGEAFPVSIANHFKDSGIALRNLYGPSEDTTYSSYYRVEGFYESSVPVGKAIDNTQFYILSDALALQPVGVIGEICISGDGLSRGYLYQPELTAEKFIENPFKEGTKLYKTGDLGKWLPDGTVVCIGRKDSQVKIRGYRIELGEIEQVLQAQEGIDQCVVVTATVQGDPVIVSYLVSTSAVDKQQLRLALGRELPDYMVPSYFVFLNQLPLTPNGKIDKNALPAVSSADVIQLEYIAPTDEIEEKLVAIWEDILGLEKIGVTDNFFELGGNSLKATVLINRINRTFDTRFSIQDLYESQDVIGVSEKLKFIVFQNQLAGESTDDLDEIMI
ncbi:hypothetical protein Flavo103_41180 [Flavobacterium collinsii]|uniref:non-ribosomal peptide synthetase n=1 Tax=Flavobacterium collinsii TaxID=1114861 RepID=UPI0022C7C706|nr:non-ribosomal peptide synthetase [Flavobacterium collinsii]GIQ60982.1 hypothetical protein Flavo103_41180 [Flavobacterium collinsii]